MQARILATLLFAATPVFAQTPAAPAGDAPKHSCTKPGEMPSPTLASDYQLRAYQKEYVAYTECLKKFAMDQQKLAEPHVKAANDTITEYNAAVKFYNDAVAKAKAAK